MELLTVMGIIAILALIAFPVMSRLVPSQRVSSDAKRVDAFMQKARLRAATAQKPIRVVLNCAASPCWIELQTALYTGNAVTGWGTGSGDRHVFNNQVRVFTSTTSADFDGATKAPAGVRYAIFMPDSRVFSDPRPFDVFFYYSSPATVNPKEGFRLSVSNDSGRVSTKREAINVPTP
jgi:Tfp pilus assembly protein FimT